MKQLEGRIAIVTGGGQGIGAGICSSLAAAGAAIVIFDRNGERAQSVSAKLVEAGARALAHVGDVTIAADVAAAIASTASAFGGVDILVNNVAPARNRKLLRELSRADWEIHSQGVLAAAVHLTETALPYLAGTGRGAVINISSVVAFGVAEDQCSRPYHVSKAGLDQLTRYLASRLGPSSIRVNSVSPGLVDRDEGRKLTEDPVNRAVTQKVVPLRRAARVKEIADVVVFLASDQASYITGQVLVVDGGLSTQEVFGAGLRAYHHAAGSSTG